MQTNRYYKISPHADLRARFAASYVPEPNSGCWLWVASVQSEKDNPLRGAIIENGKSRFAHRVAYELLVGPIPPRTNICHLCNNSLCVNPEHLYTGDQKSNVADMFRAGRGRYQATSPVLAAAINLIRKELGSGRDLTELLASIEN